MSSQYHRQPSASHQYIRTQRALDPQLPTRIPSSPQVHPHPEGPGCRALQQRQGEQDLQRQLVLHLPADAGDAATVLQMARAVVQQAAGCDDGSIESVQVLRGAPPAATSGGAGGVAGSSGEQQQQQQQQQQRRTTVTVTCKTASVRQAALRNKKSLRGGAYRQVYLDEALTRQQRMEKARLMPRFKELRANNTIVTWRGAEMHQLVMDGPRKRWVRVEVAS